MYCKPTQMMKQALPCLFALALLAGPQCGQAQIAPPVTTLYSFTGGGDGYNGGSSLIQNAQGYLLGTTSGRNGSTLFSLSPNGVVTSVPAPTGWALGVPFQAGDGNYYGVASSRGSNGYVYKLSSAGVLSTFYTFTGGADGGFPTRLTVGNDNYAYGTTVSGGANTRGTFFKLSAAGVLTPLYNFAGADGIYGSGVILGTDGNFYGTMSNDTVSYNGTAYKITSSGAFTFLHRFNGTDGQTVNGPLVEGNDGNFYGTSKYGGVTGYGSIFQMTPSGTVTLLYSCDSTNGNRPGGGLMLGPDGNLYGTTPFGGANNAGTLFQITPAGTLTTLFSFSNNGVDGAYPSAPPLLGRDGNLYGSTANGGVYNYGTIYKVTMTPTAYAFYPGSGPVGTVITLSGVNFTETTSVKIGTKAATFTVKGDTSLNITVPAGAATGAITVTTPFGSVTTAGTFQVH